MLSALILLIQTVASTIPGPPSSGSFIYMDLDPADYGRYTTTLDIKNDDFQVVFSTTKEQVLIVDKACHQCYVPQKLNIAAGGYHALSGLL